LLADVKWTNSTVEQLTKDAFLRIEKAVADCIRYHLGFKSLCSEEKLKNINENASELIKEVSIRNEIDIKQFANLELVRKKRNKATFPEIVGRSLEERCERSLTLTRAENYEEINSGLDDYEVLYALIETIETPLNASENCVLQKKLLENVIILRMDRGFPELKPILTKLVPLLRAWNIAFTLCSRMRKITSPPEGNQAAPSKKVIRTLSLEDKKITHLLWRIFIQFRHSQKPL
jgi:hypothetical protein